MSLLEYFRSRTRGTRVAIAFIASLILTVIVAVVVVKSEPVHRTSGTSVLGPWTAFVGMVKQAAQKSKVPTERQIIDGSATPANP